MTKHAINGDPFIIEYMRGEEAQSSLARRGFQVDWRDLQQRCNFATAFQSPGFVCSWYQTYQLVWEPVVLVAREPGGEMVGLWLLAYNATDRTLVHAGAHQSEYHAWLALPEHSKEFIRLAWKKLTASLSFRCLHFRYIPHLNLTSELQGALGPHAALSVRTHRRPLLRIDGEDIRASFAKKGNKSRVNRLRKLGQLTFERISDAARLEQIIDELTAFYDFRQGAINDTSPFRDDRHKRRFHLELMSQAADELVVTTMILQGQPIAAFWGSRSQCTVHLGMLIHSPFFASHSPGKLHMMQLSDHLFHQTDIRTLDLTPGGDPWKERFANDHDAVSEVTVYRSQLHYRMKATIAWSTVQVKRLCGLMGITPDDLRGWLRTVRRVRPATLARRIRSWGREYREYRIYRATRSLALERSSDSRVKVNDLTDLLLFQPSEPWQTRKAFLASALERLENGESVYTIQLDSQLAHYGWLVAQSESRMSEVDQTLSLPIGSVSLYDFYTAPRFRGQGLYRATIGHMLSAAFDKRETRYAFISVLADNLPSRHVIESVGFQYQGSFHWRRRLGKVTKWADTFQPEYGHGQD